MQTNHDNYLFLHKLISYHTDINASNAEQWCGTIRHQVEASGSVSTLKAMNADKFIPYWTAANSLSEEEHNDNLIILRPDTIS